MSDEVKKKIEEQFITRCKFQNIKFKSKTFYREQASFFAGAMAALNAATGEEPSPAWCIACMSDREIVTY